MYLRNFIFLVFLYLLSITNAYSTVIVLGALERQDNTNTVDQYFFTLNTVEEGANTLFLLSKEEPNDPNFPLALLRIYNDDGSLDDGDIIRSGVNPNQASINQNLLPGSYIVTIGGETEATTTSSTLSNTRSGNYSLKIFGDITITKTLTGNLDGTFTDASVPEASTLVAFLISLVFLWKIPLK